MTSPYTTVLGVDAYHLQQLANVWPTWVRHKPSLLKAPLVIFYDPTQVDDWTVNRNIPHPDINIVPWQCGITGDRTGKWHDPQRAKMLAGFVHIPPQIVTTPYWLKIDTDTVAVGQDDWIDPTWFESPSTAIIAQRWGYTKPPNQMQLLDDWVTRHWDRTVVHELDKHPALDLVPNEGSNALPHPRIISWCGFFNTAFSKTCSRLARETEEVDGALPVPSQDGFMWYVATRLGLTVKRVCMKSRGWEHWTTQTNINAAVGRALS